MENLEKTATFRYDGEYYTLEQALYKMEKPPVSFQFQKALLKAQKQFLKSQKKGVVFEAYPVKEYWVDNFIKGNIFISSPFFSKPIFLYADKLSIKKIKYMLSHTDTNGMNLIQSFPYVGPKKTQKILKAMDFYDEQVERQAKYLHSSLWDLNYDAFFQDEGKRMRIIMDDYDAILDYLLENAQEEYIWGEATDHQKKMLDESRKENLTYWNLVSMLVTYTTLEELEQGITKGDTLKRFIVK